MAAHSTAQPVFTFEEYWARRYASVVRQTALAGVGWSAPAGVSDVFVEPDLKQQLEGDPRIVLISAPGAVGKSMYATQLAGAFGLVIFDLAEAGPVGENTLIGSAFRFLGSDGPAQIKAGTVGLVIDALDEGQLKVTPEAYAAFLRDVAELAPESGPPIVLFGRTGAVEEAWGILSDMGLSPLVLEIALFDEEKASRFVHTLLTELGKTNNAVRTHLAQYEDVATTLVSRLRKLTAGDDGGAFAGYAPVLDAICRAVAEESNPATFASEIHGDVAIQLLSQICERILVRERDKLLSNLALEGRVTGEVFETLYTPGEQRARLSEKLFQVPNNHREPALDQDALEEYHQGIERFFPQHPFLDGTGRKVANPVFAADLGAHLLHENESVPPLFSNPAVARNPFLFDFYSMHRRDDPHAPIPVSHGGLLYTSLTASADIGQHPSLFLVDGDGSEPPLLQVGLIDEDDGLLLKWIEGPPRGELLTLPDIISDIVVNSSTIAVELGNGGLTVLESPVFIATPLLSIRGAELYVRPPRRLQQESPPQAQLDVTLMADDASVSTPINSRRPNVSGPVNFSVTWDGSEQFPWTEYNAAPRAEREEDVHRAYQLLRNLIVAFRSHSRGELKRYADKIENRRLTRNDLALAIRQQLLRDEVLRLEDKFYALDATRLGELLDIDYMRIRKGISSDKCDAYLRAIVRALPEE